MKTVYNTKTNYTQYTVIESDLNLIKTDKYNIIVNQITGGWAAVNDQEMAILLFGNKIYDIEFGESVYQAGLVKKNGSYVFNIKEVQHISDTIHEFEYRITDSCNLNCVYCSSEACNINTVKPNLEIGMLWIDRIYDYIKIHNCKHIDLEFTGGEPLLFVDYLKEVIDYAKKKFSSIESLDVSYSVVTNLTLLDEKHLDFLKSIGANTIQVSLDGTKEIHDRHRPYHSGKGSFDTIIKNIKRLKASGFETTTIASVITKESEIHMLEIAEFLTELGFTRMTLQPMCQIGKATTKVDLALNPKIYVDKLFEILDKVVVPYWEKTHQRMFIRCFAITFAYLLKPWRRYMCQHCPCGAGTSIISVDQNGDVYGCNTAPFDSSTLYGNIYDLSFDECVCSENALISKERRLENIKECNVCSIKTFCQGGCTKSALSTYGIVNAPGDICEINKEIFVRSMEAILDEKYPIEMIKAMGKSFLMDDYKL